MGIKMKIKNLGLLFGLIGVTFTGYAADKYNCKKECPETPRADCKSLCFAGPNLECDRNLDVMGAALFAQFRVDNSELALETSSNTNFVYPENAVGIQSPEKASWGFKVGLGWKTGHDDWKLAARYTWLRAISDGQFQPVYGGAYFPVLYTNSHAASGESFQNLEGGNYTWLSNLNLYLIRPTLQTALLEISPYCGVDFTVTRRRETVTFTDLSSGESTYSDGGYFRTYNRNLWWGVGPMAGVSTSWYVGFDVSIVAETYLALTYGQAQSFSDTTEYQFDQQNYSTSNYVINNDFYQFSPEMYTQLGLMWNHTFDNEKNAFSFKVAYENSYYFQANKRIQNDIRYRVAESGSMAYQGLVLQGQFDF
jgi:hypothetical protein